MKYLFQLTVLILFFSSVIYTQDEAYIGEVSIYIKNNSGSNVEIEMEQISSLCWNVNLSDPDLHDITSSFTGGRLNTTQNNLLEFYVCWEQYTMPDSLTFGLGYYKFTAKVNGIYKDHFFIDYRTSDLNEAIRSGCDIDVVLYFSVTHGKFYSDFGLQTEFYEDIEFWALRECVEEIKTELEPLPPNNLHLTSSGGHPYLTWSHSTNTGDYWTGYKIYREIRAEGNPSFTEDDWIATVGKYTTGYIDPTYYVGHGWEGYYCVKTINGNRVSDFSEILEINIDAFSKGSEEIKPEYEYNLSQNYPNPFNPITQISFSIRENSFVSIKVFDVLGSEISVLINETMAAGKYSIQFDGSNLDSGIYFYEIQAGDFRDVKKLILLK